MVTEGLDLCGDIIDSRYRVESRVGQGGMGIVWQVRHLQTRQLFALKTVYGSRTPDRKILRRLLHEARATAAIQSRNVVRIVDVRPDYVHSGFELPFIVMEFLKGNNFSGYLEGVPHLEIGELVWVTRQVSHALALAHGHGIVHRDLKPSNIFLAEDDDGQVTVKVCDFGIAKLQGAALVDLAETGTLSTETGALFGTPKYMAPEQLRKAGSETPATDQWALGLIVFRAITGRSYFDGARNLAELILAIAHEPLPKPSNVSGLFPHSLDAWFMQSCARSAADRFESILIQQQEFEKALGCPPEIAIEAGNLRLWRPRVSPNSDDISQQFWNAQPAYRGAEKTRRSLGVLYACLGLAGIATVVATQWIAARITITNSSERPEQAVPRISSSIEPRSSVAVASVVSELANAKINSVASVEATQPKAKESARRQRPLRPYRHEPGVNPATAQLLPLGAPCVRSAQCQEGLCAAEVCQ